MRAIKMVACDFQCFQLWLSGTQGLYTVNVFQDSISVWIGREELDKGKVFIWCCFFCSKCLAA